MSRTKKAEADKVAVKLLCIYSGDGASASAGSVIDLDADEAARLIDLGVAETVKK